MFFVFFLILLGVLCIVQFLLIVHSGSFIRMVRCVVMYGKRSRCEVPTKIYKTGSLKTFSQSISHKIAYKLKEMKPKNDS